MRDLATLLLALGLVACGDDLPDQDPGTSTGPECGTDCATTGTTAIPDPSTTSGPSTLDSTAGSTGSSSSDDGPETVGIPDECQLSRDCDLGELCVAPFDPDLGPEGKGPNECVSECVVIMDELRWCLDAAACCDPEAECTDRGYCVLPGDETEGSSDGGSSDGGMGTSTDVPAL